MSGARASRFRGSSPSDSVNVVPGSPTLSCRASTLAPIVSLAALSALLWAPVASAQESAPPLAPQRPGFAIEASAGAYIPTGHLSKVSSPGEWTRVAIGWDAKRWFELYASADVAFLATDRAQGPPTSHAYRIWGFEGGGRFLLPLGDRVRIPFRLGVGAHAAVDDDVLSTYGFASEQSLGVTFSGATGVEWRAASRHFGLYWEIGARMDTAIKHSSDGAATIAILSCLGLHYTL